MSDTRILSDKNILVVGGGTLGKPTALCAARKGARRVIVTSRDAAKATHIAAELSAEIQTSRPGFKFESAPVDVASPELIQTSVQGVLKVLGDNPLHGAVIMAGGNNGKANQGLVKTPIAEPRALDHDARKKFATSLLCADSAARLSVYQANVLGPVEFLDELSRELLLIQDAGCSVVFIGSVAPLANLSGVDAYAGAKAALLVEMRNRAACFARACHEMGREVIRLNAVTWGFSDSPQSRGMIRELEGDGFTFRGKAVLNRTPLRRLGKPEEIGPQIALLLSDESAYTTGSEFVLDGGFSNCGGV